MKKHPKKIRQPRKHICHVCGKHNATIFSTDPFYDELPGLLPEDEDNIEEWWCENCYQECIWEI